MPPKKGAAKAGAPATAAASRPRRSAAPTPPAKPTTKAAAPVAGKKRGRPAKSDDADTAEPPKKRGRPSKSASATSAPEAGGAAKARGRPAKGKTQAAVVEDDAPAVPHQESAPPKKRGRPPKGGETTKIEAAEEAAAEQLEEELVEAVEEEGVEGGEPRKRKTPVETKGVSAKRRGKLAVSAVDDAVEDAVVAKGGDDDDAGEAGSQRQYWLMKAEQEDREETLKDGSVFNAKFTIDDLRAKAAPEPWDGVRNPTACKNMKAMKRGDLAFFYASGGKQGRVPGIVGIMEVVREHQPDLSAFDENSYGYVENAKMRGTVEKPRWYMVHVEFRRKLSQPVTLTELKKYAEKDSVLSHMQELTSARLSVSKVTEKEWNFIVDNLIEGYDDDDDAASLPTPVPTGPKINPNGGEAMVVIKRSIEDDAAAAAADVPPTDSMAPLDTLATSSRPASRVRSKKPASRARSLAPPAPARATSRGRSRTPRAASAQPQPATGTSTGLGMGVVVEEEMELFMA